MANIKVNELNPAGTQLFSDAENFLNELSHEELYAINGGGGELPSPVDEFFTFHSNYCPGC